MYLTVLIILGLMLVVLVAQRMARVQQEPVRLHVRDERRQRSRSRR